MKKNTLPSGIQYVCYNGEEKHTVVNSYHISMLMVQRNEDSAERDTICCMMNYVSMKDMIVDNIEVKSIHRESA